MIEEEDKSITNRVFCVGMNKTGTSTLKSCFITLGFEPVASPKTLDKESRKRIQYFYDHENYEDIIELAKEFRSFEDRPWNMWEMYKHLDQAFPDSLFILTYRDPESWWRSTERWLTVTKPMVLSRYLSHLKVESYDKQAMIESYEKYNQDVIQYFDGRGKLLVMDLEASDEWVKLCEFLDCEVPDLKFPRVNRQSYSDKDNNKYKKKKLKWGKKRER